ncbi:MAG: hypothetical protein Q7U47_03680 [Paludibacter sp.]|nr:hypothetical protein [Paludibacter sp.]
MFRKIFFLILFVVIITHTVAQTISLSNRPIFGLIVNQEYNFISFTKLNNFLETNGNYITISSQLYQSDFNFGFSVRNNIYSPVTVQLIMNNCYSHFNAKKTNFYVAGISLNILYSVINKKEWEVSPLISFALKNSGITLINRYSLSTISHDYLEETFYRKIYLGTKIGFDLKKNLAINNYQNIKFGFSPFYFLDFGDKSWYNNNNTKVDDLPLFSTSCFGITCEIEIEF